MGRRPVRSDIWVLALLVGAPGPLAAQEIIPSGWSRCGRGGVVTVDSTYRVEGGRSLFLSAVTRGSGQVVACVQQMLDAKPFRGHELRASAWLRGTPVGRGGLWIEIYQPGGVRSVAPLLQDSLRQVQYRWTEFEARVIVPPDADSVALGLSSFGGYGEPGLLWADQLTFRSVEIRGLRMGDSPPPSPPFPPRPVVPLPFPTNLSFEE